MSLGHALLVTHEYAEPCYEQSEIDGLLAPDDWIERHILDTTTWQLPPLADYDAVIIFVRFRELMERDSLPWSGYSGLKVLLDQDSFMDFCGWHGRSPYEGKWTETFRRLGFDLLICTGRRSAEHFAEQGIPAAVLHKAYDERYFHPLGQERAGICHYGSPYAARLKMLKAVKKAGITVDDVRAPYTQLNSVLNAHESVLICNMTSVIPFGRNGARIEHRMPGSILRVQPAPEPMIKNFEAMGAGCCVFTDPSPDDAELGFVDGETCVIYDGFDDLIDRTRHYARDTSLTTAIGTRGYQLVRSRHTWMHRGTELRHLLERQMITGG